MSDVSHEQLVEEWLRSFLSVKFSIAPSRIDRNHQLKDWGFDSSMELAVLIGSFNQESRSKPGWQQAEILPPEILAKAPKTIGDLISALVSAIEGLKHLIDSVETAFVLKTRHSASDVIAWLVTTELPPMAPGKPIRAESTFSQLVIDTGSADFIQIDFSHQFNVAVGLVDLNTIYDLIKKDVQVRTLGTWLAGILV